MSQTTTLSIEIPILDTSETQEFLRVLGARLQPLVSLKIAVKEDRHTLGAEVRVEFISGTFTSEQVNEAVGEALRKVRKQSTDS